MNWFLCGASLLFYYAGHPSSALLLRCSLQASQRFSPRAALAISSLAALSSATTGLCFRRSWRIGPSAQYSAIWGGFIGGVLGRSALLMIAARLSSSLILARIQTFPLLALALLALIPSVPVSQRIMLSPVRLFVFSILSGALDGFLGAGSMPFLSLTASGGVRRWRDTPSYPLLTSAAAQTGAILLTLLCGQAQLFPIRMVISIIAGSIIGTIMVEKQKERGALHSGIRTALRIYVFLAALSCTEQAFLPPA